MRQIKDYLEHIDDDGWEQWIAEAAARLNPWRDEYEAILRNYYEQGLSPVKAVRKVEAETENFGLLTQLKLPK